MPILVQNLRIPLGNADNTALEHEAIRLAARQLGLPEKEMLSAGIWKKSLDARKKTGTPAFVVSVRFSLKSAEKESAFVKCHLQTSLQEDSLLEIHIGKEKMQSPVYIAGFGPAGIFAAHLLARNGYRPVVLERGESIERRASLVDDFWAGGSLDVETNVQFGEGGAGTFSDGKLTTRISDPRCGYILREFVRHGAPEEILRTAKPHIGTDKLRGVIVSMREEIVRLGGAVRFGSRLDGIGTQNGRITSVLVNGIEEPAGALILAVGHSARDTFRMLSGQGIALEPKPFSVGVRLEQLQTAIDSGLYGEYAGDPRLPQGEYQLSHRNPDGRCVYTFCMCPGGFVVPSMSAEDTVVTNGMSYHARDGKNANAALVVSVEPQDVAEWTGAEHSPLAGILFQEKLERAAFHMGGGGYSAPAMTVGQFLGRKSGFRVGNVEPTFSRGVCGGDFDRLFPSAVSDMLRLGLTSFERKLHGFAAPDGILTGVETRTSSPVRIPREAETLEAVGLNALYPCGEGAGYAGGIVSAAADGLRVAQAVIARFAIP